MPSITFVDAAGVKTTVDTQVGRSVMETALDNTVDGIVGDCGGSLACASCHVYVDEGWRHQVSGPASAEEDDMLEGTMADRREYSRLSCQIRLTDQLDGLVVHLPLEQ
ncbi:2Fe-2S iron-sulfur cluster-binding protein [Rhodococcus sp. NPDC057014]|uniref:2Fe-2S iron-sulfur cluster-binding protein n=1 Tax=Rhodococcus sp. NPDC057014 TaxID=3346000 RepID=UPI003634CEB4